MGWLITIDPGASMGVAVWRDGTLIAVRRDLPARTLEISQVVIERPVARWKGTVEDVATLAIRAGIVAGVSLERWGVAARMIAPTDWKGTMGKSFVPSRCRASLTPEELALTKGASADQWDAIGIGLWVLGRWPRKKDLDLTSATR
jgi:hypothetical protein